MFFVFFFAALGLRCCSSCGERGLLLVAVRGLLIEVASLVAARGLSSCGTRAPARSLSSCGTRAQLLRGMWDLPGPGLEPVFPALAGRFLTTAPPGKSKQFYILFQTDSVSSLLPKLESLLSALPI